MSRPRPPLQRDAERAAVRQRGLVLDRQRQRHGRRPAPPRKRLPHRPSGEPASLGSCLDGVVIDQTNACFDTIAQCGVALRAPARGRARSAPRCAPSWRSGRAGRARHGSRPCCRRNSPPPRRPRFRAARGRRFARRPAPRPARLSLGVAHPCLGAGRARRPGSVPGGCIARTACSAHQTVSRRGSRKAQKLTASSAPGPCASRARKASGRSIVGGHGHELDGGGKGLEDLARGGEAET